MLKRTPLYPVYASYPGVKMVEFRGWEMPLNFAPGIIAEHLAVRTVAGLFDVSHMGEFFFEGPGSTELLDWLVTNNVKRVEVGQALYSPMCLPDGGTIDDLIIYRLAAEHYMVVVNAANTASDFEWMSSRNPLLSHKPGAVRGRTSELRTLPAIEDRSDATALLAFQGPEAQRLLQPLVSTDLGAIAPFHFVQDVKVAHVGALLSRTGYTGEAGFELYLDSRAAATVWEEIVAASHSAGALPCGLGARDTLRLESRLALYGHELSETITPLEAGLKAFVKLEKEDFCGREALAKQVATGPARSLRGFEMIDRGVPRNGYRVWRGAEEIGVVTSGAKSPMLDSFVGLALLSAGHGELGSEIEIDFGERRKRGRIVKTPFYKRTGGRK